MATINTDLVMASVPQVDIAGAIGSGISSYYGVKEMQDAQTERDMLLEQRENEVWSSNKNKWIEYARSGFVSPQNVTDWIAFGQEDGIYDDSAAQMMRNEVGNIIDSDEYANITHLLDTANGTRKANMGLQSRMAELDAEMASYENIPITPMVQTRMSEINSEKQTLSTKIANNNASLAGLEEGLQMSSANAMEQYNTQVMGGIQGWIDEVISATSDIEEIRLGTPKVLYRTDGDEVKEKIVATESDYISSVGSGEWSTMEPVKETFFDADGGEHFMFPEEAMDKGYTTDKPGLAVGATPTDIDDFVARANQQAILDTGEELTPGQQNEAALQFKRAQAEEVEATEFAKKTVDEKTSEKIAYNTKLGTELAEIATAGALIEAKGELTPVQTMNIAKTRMSGNLANMAEHYMQLDSMGSMLNVDNTTFENITAAASASSIGQQWGRITGSDAQSIRSSINKLKPLLIQDIRQSTDMGARGLDSEKELEFYLQAATDEKTDIQSNIAAIVVLDEAFGEGKVSEKLRALTDESLIMRIADDGRTILSGGETPLTEGQIEVYNPETGEFEVM
jgi:hypothetical protein